MSGDQKAFERVMNSGHTAAWELSWERAAHFYRAALEEFPNHPMALNNLALAMYEMADYQQALVYYQQAAQAAADDPLPYEKIARIYESLGKNQPAVQVCLKAAELHLKARNVEKALENWLRAIYLQPDHVLARTRLAMVYERIGRKNEAAGEYLATASLMQQSGDRDKAMQVVEYVMQLTPNNEAARRALQRLRNDQPLPKPARPRPAGLPSPAPVSRAHQPAALKEAGEVEAMDPIAAARRKAMEDIASLLFEQAEEGLPATTTRKNLDALTRGVGSPIGTADRTRIMLHLGQAIESQSQGMDNQAAAELERAMEIGVNHPAVFFDAGMLIAHRNGARALGYLQKSAHAAEYALASYLVMAQIYQQEGSPTKALSAYLQALRLADAATVSAEAADELMQLYEPIIEEQAHNKDEAAAALIAKTVAGQLLRPDWRTCLAAARQELPAQPKGGPPLPLAELLLSGNSGQVVEALARVRQMVNQKKYRSAMEEAFNTLQLAPLYLPVHTQIGDILIRSGRLQDAVVKFMLVAELYRLRGEAGQAIRLLTRVVEMAPMELKVRTKLIDLLVAQRRTEEALQQYMELATAYYHLAELNLARQAYVAALRLAHQVKTDRTWSTEILYKLADIDLQRLDLRQAVRVFEQIRTLEPEDLRARRSIIDLNFRLGQDAAALSEVDGFTALLEHSGKRDAAIDFLLDLTADRSQSMELNRRLAELYMRGGQVQQAVERLDMIADGLLKAGDREGAAATLKAIIALKPINVNKYRLALEKLARSEDK
ncbi:MAG: tetratricopeptide repeat protein [Anaerolineaceae bacterium]|jgi:tetratricopeptide (TPR) repeat protein